MLQDLPKLWAEAIIGERRRLLLTKLEAVYVDARDDKAVVALKPKWAFKALFEIATTRNGSGIVLVTTKPPNFSDP